MKQEKPGDPSIDHLCYTLWSHINAREYIAFEKEDVNRRDKSQKCLRIYTNTDMIGFERFGRSTIAHQLNIHVCSRTYMDDSVEHCIGNNPEDKASQSLYS